MSSSKSLIHQRAETIRARLMVYYENDNPPNYLSVIPAWNSFRRVVDLLGADCSYVLAICNAIRVQHPDVVKKLLDE